MKNVEYFSDSIEFTYIHTYMHTSDYHDHFKIGIKICCITECEGGGGGGGSSDTEGGSCADGGGDGFVAMAHSARKGPFRGNWKKPKD